MSRCLLRPTEPVFATASKSFEPPDSLVEGGPRDDTRPDVRGGPGDASVAGPDASDGRPCRAPPGADDPRGEGGPARQSVDRRQPAGCRGRLRPGAGRGPRRRGCPRAPRRGGWPLAEKVAELGSRWIGGSLPDAEADSGQGPAADRDGGLAVAPMQEVFAAG